MPGSPEALYTLGNSGRCVWQPQVKPTTTVSPAQFWLQSQGTQIRESSVWSSNLDFTL